MDISKPIPQSALPDKIYDELHEFKAEVNRLVADNLTKINPNLIINGLLIASLEFFFFVHGNDVEHIERSGKILVDAMTQNIEKYTKHLKETGETNGMDV